MIFEYFGKLKKFQFKIIKIKQLVQIYLIKWNFFEIKENINHKIDDIMNVKSSNLDVGNKSIPIEVDKNKHENKIEKILNSKVNRIRKCFKEMVMHSTIHALPKIIKADKFYFKIMWILFFITIEDIFYDFFFFIPTEGVVF